MYTEEIVPVEAPVPRMKLHVAGVLGAGLPPEK
jgi:hypothetical protein